MSSFYDDFKEELNRQSTAIQMVADRVCSTAIEEALEFMLLCTGKVVVTGMGKAGLIGRKISATLASTGTTSIFMHPAEAAHGDLGMLQRGDVVIAISNSGETQELVSIIPYIKFSKIPLIALTGDVQSRLARHANVTIDCKIPKDFEQLGLVPTASSTVELAVGDALAVSLLRLKQFSKEDYAKYHPGGSIGKKLLKVGHIMHDCDEIPFTDIDSTMDKTIMEMTGKNFGCTLITVAGELKGIVTDGDLRRYLQSGDIDIKSDLVADVMTKNPKHVKEDALAADVLSFMEKYKISVIPVINKLEKVVGLVHIHDLVDAGVI